MKQYKLFFSSVLITVFISCKYEMPVEPEPEPPSTGSVNFNKYVSVGDGITAGFMHAALYPEGQENSFPKLLSIRIMQVHDISFNQPLLASPTGNGFNPIHSVPSIPLIFGRLYMERPACLQRSITAKPRFPGDLLTPYSGNKAELNNFGVPGMKMLEIIVPNYGTLNPFYGRFATDPANVSVLADAASRQPTFFTLWLGNQDVLGYAIAGGMGNTDGTAPTDMTPVSVFQFALNTALDALSSSGSDVKGVVGNIPDVLSWPFFTTVNNSLLSGQKLPFNLSANEASGLTLLYNSMGWGNPGFTEGTVNYFTIETATGVRQMNPGKDYILLSASSDSLGTGPIDPCDPGGDQRAGWGITKPIPNQFVLDETQVENVRLKIELYNQEIKAQADARANIALVDMNNLLHQLNTTGVPSGIGTIKASIPFGGAISLDGLHPTPKGSAVFANKFIDAINNTFNANLHHLNPNSYKGIEIP